MECHVHYHYSPYFFAVFLCNSLVDRTAWPVVSLAYFPCVSFEARSISIRLSTQQEGGNIDGGDILEFRLTLFYYTFQHITDSAMCAMKSNVSTKNVVHSNRSQHADCTILQLSNLPNERTTFQIQPAV